MIPNIFVLLKLGPSEKYRDVEIWSELRPKLAQIVGLGVSTHRFD